MTQITNTPPPIPNKMPGYTGECALPPSGTTSAIGHSGIRYYSNEREQPERQGSKS